MSHATTAAAVAALLSLATPAVLAAQGQVVRLPAADRPLTGEAPVVFAIGRAEGADHEMFGRVATVAFDGDDNLYVLDSQSARVMVYDRAGRFVRQVGRSGRGPGELTLAAKLAVSPDGTVVVFHRSSFSVFDPAGRFVESWPVEDWIFRSAAPAAWHPRGVVGVSGSMRGFTGATGTVVDRNVLVVYPLGGAPARVFDFPQTWTTEMRSQGQNRMSMSTYGPATFAALESFGVLPDGTLAMHFTSGYTVRVVALDGTTLRYLQRPMRVRLTTEADRERARERQRERLASGVGMIRMQGGSGGGTTVGGPPDRAAIDRSVAEMRFADTVAAVRGIRVAPSGTIWVERTSDTYYDPGPIDLITAAGEYRGTITGTALPAAISRGGLAAFIEPGEDDVPRVVVRRLPEAWQ